MSDKYLETKLEYMKTSQKRISLNWLKEDFEGRIAPAISRSGKTVSGFIKEAVVEKLIREGYLSE